MNVVAGTRKRATSEDTGSSRDRRRRDRPGDRWPTGIRQGGAARRPQRGDARLSGPGAQGYRAMIDRSAAGRVGTTDEVATAAAYLLGPDAGFITGADLLIDGGVIAALRAGRLQVQLR